MLATELAIARHAGIRTIVDATPIGLGRRPAELVRLAEETGMRVVAGTGYYRRTFLPPGGCVARAAYRVPRTLERDD